jgi:hypothetical protein
MKQSEAFMQAARNGERLGTCMLYTINGSKRLQNHVHALKTKELLQKQTKLFTKKIYTNVTFVSRKF